MKKDNSRVIFRVKEGIAPAEIVRKTTLKSFEVRRLHEIDTSTSTEKSKTESKLFRTFLAEGVAGTIDPLLHTLKENGNVEYVQLDEMNSLYLTPSQSRTPIAWGIERIGCYKAWQTTQGEDVIVAVIDTGVDYNHPDISGNMWTDDARNYGKDFSNGDDDPMDYSGHGSHCAGTIAAINSATGSVGVAPRAKIMALKIFPRPFDSVCSAAIRYAADHGARVLSIGWGMTRRRPSNPAVEDAINYAVKKACIVVCAAGNLNDDVQYYSPANHPDVISVAATDINDARARFSNFGSLITIAAPGSNILSLRMNTDRYMAMNGTSMACSHVSGLVALMLQSHGPLSISEVKQLLRERGDVIQTDKPISGRRINAAKSV